MITIRDARLEDSKALLAIYKPYVEKTAITYEYEVPTEEEFRSRVANTLQKYPYLVAVDENDEIIGYTYASAFKGRKAYDWSVETSIYVMEGRHGEGLGKQLYQKLEDALKEMGIRNLCACIAYPNPESERFHEKLGYETVAHFHKSGFKHGKWYDMIWMEKFVGEHIEEPQDVIPYPILGKGNRN